MPSDTPETLEAILLDIAENCNVRAYHGINPICEREEAALRKAVDLLQVSHREALTLATSLKRNFPDAKEWQPLPDVPGLISQIDNMAAGLRQQRDDNQQHYHNAMAEVRTLRQLLQSARDQLVDQGAAADDSEGIQTIDAALPQVSK